MRRYQLLRILADGRFHSGEALGAALGTRRSAVWKHLQTLAEWGVDLHAVPGKGYRLPHPLELLDRDVILRALRCTGTCECRERHDAGSGHGQSVSLLSGLEIHHDIDSTNRHLMHKARLGAPSGQACLAERQQAGRGRRGRVWVSPFGANIYLSLLWRFSLNAESLSGLGLAVGVAVNRALQEEGLVEAGLKWPNDILWQGRKLAGILLEMSGEMSGPCAVVIGVGLNVHMRAAQGCASAAEGRKHPQGVRRPTAGRLRAGCKELKPQQRTQPEAAAATQMIDQPWVSMETALGRPVSRNQLAARLLQHLSQALHQFEISGFSAFQQEWAQHDLAYGQTVTLHMPNSTVTGIGRGVDASGALLVEDNGKVRPYPYGEVSLRLVS